MKQFDLIGQAKTGSGKTASFGLPILAQLNRGKSRQFPRALILVPTRELANQVSAEINKLGDQLSLSCQAIYIGSLNIRVTITGQSLVTKLVAKDP